MPRKTHGKARAREDVYSRVILSLPVHMRSFLESEAKRIGEERGRKVLVTDVIRALITAYYEKKMAGILVGVDD